MLLPSSAVQFITFNSFHKQKWFKKKKANTNFSCILSKTRETNKSDGEVIDIIMVFVWSGNVDILEQKKKRFDLL